MKIYSETYREECDVYGISISFERNRPASKRIIFYITNPGMFGLGIEEFEKSRILDNRIGRDFKVHLFKNGDGVIFLWDHFTGIDHLARLIDLDPDIVSAFESALNERAISS
jgi:hypothetical protein